MLDKVVRGIKDLDIQGATNIAYAALDALAWVVKSSRDLTKARKKLLNTRPNEPMMYNAVNYVFNKVRAGEDGLEVIKNLKKKFDESTNLMVDAGKGLIKKKNTVFTHCHSSSVMKIFKASKKNIARVFCTESRPRYQGRLTAKELLSVGLKVSQCVDSAVADYIKKVDAFFIGCDVITSTSIINKVGSRMISLLCDKYDIPLYVCSLSYKFEPRSIKGISQDVEERSTSEVWDRPPKGLKILNPSFDVVDFEAITGFVTELGVLPPDSFINSMSDKAGRVFD
jgi:ribose 1,5-bisphosphate isomerase